MKYIINFNHEEQRVEIVCMNNKGNLETIIHGDDTLSVRSGHTVFPASEFYEEMKEVALVVIENEKKDEIRDRHNTDTIA